MRGKDESENALTAPPADERLDWVVLWMVEVYAPSHVPRLIEGLRALGWDQRRAGSNDVVSWLQEVRGSRGTATFTLGRLGAHQRFWGSIYGQTVELPSCFEFIVPTFVALPSGVTVLIVQFALRANSQRCLEAALREDAQAKVTRTRGGGHTVTSAGGVKSERLAAVRSSIRAQAGDWMSRLAPGALAEASEEMPSWDLVLTAKSELWSGQYERGWLDTAGYSWLDRWQSERLKCSLCIPRWSDLSGSRPAFSATTAAIEGWRDARVGGGQDLDHLESAAELGERLGLPLALLGLREAVRAYERRFSALRDIRVKNRFALLRAPGQLARLERDGVPIAADAQALRRSATQIAEAEGRALGVLDGGEFGAVAEGPLRDEHRADERFEEMLLTAIVEEAREAAETGEAAVSSLKALSDILIARTNLQLQGLIVFFTILVSVLSYLTLKATK